MTACFYVIGEEEKDRKKTTKLLPSGSHKLTAVVAACSGPCRRLDLLTLRLWMGKVS